MNMSYNPQFAKLGDILVHEGIITEDTLLKALDTQKTTKKKLGDILINNGDINENDLVKAFSLQTGHKPLSEDDLFKADTESAKLIPARWTSISTSSDLGVGADSSIISMASKPPLFVYTTRFIQFHHPFAGALRPFLSEDALKGREYSPHQSMYTIHLLDIRHKIYPVHIGLNNQPSAREHSQFLRFSLPF